MNLDDDKSKVKGADMSLVMNIVTVRTMTHHYNPSEITIVMCYFLCLSIHCYSKLNGGRQTIHLVMVKQVLTEAVGPSARLIY